MNKLFLAVICLVEASLLTLTDAATVSLSPSPLDLNDLDHHSVYTWQLEGMDLSNVSITSASLTIKNISNWDTNPNVLYIHLLDTANFSGVASFIDDPTGSAPVVDLTDDFANARFHNKPGWLVKPGTRDTFLGNPSFSTTAKNYTLVFNAAQLAALTSYITNGKDFAFGFDPDCHFFNDGICFTFTTSPIPELNNAFPAILLMVLAAAFELHRRRRVIS